MTRVLERAWVSPSSRVTTAPTIGTVASRSPASPLEIRSSAWVSSSHGPAISSSANTSTQGHARRAGPSTRERSAIGSSTRAPTAVRASTTVAGSSWSTAILMKRYGVPQMTPIAANSAHADPVMCPVPVIGAPAPSGCRWSGATASVMARRGYPAPRGGDDDAA